MIFSKKKKSSIIFICRKCKFHNILKLFKLKIEIRTFFPKYYIQMNHLRYLAINQNSEQLETKVKVERKQCYAMYSIISFHLQKNLLLIKLLTEKLSFPVSDHDQGFYFLE